MITEDAIKEDEYVTNDVTKNVTNEIANVTNEILNNLSDRQKTIVRMLMAEPKITVDELVERIIVNRRTILRDIKSLQENGLLTRKGGCAEGHWIVNLYKE